MQYLTVFWSGRSADSNSAAVHWGEQMLALLGLCTIALLLAVILTKRMSPLVALIVIPVAAALIGGFGLDTGKFVLTGLQNLAGVVGMFVFAILFFGIVSDAGMLDPIVDRILAAVGTRPTRIVPGTTLLALLIHLDGSGAVTFLITIPAMLPLYDRVGIDRRILACAASMAAGVNFLPWTGPMIRASAALKLPIRRSSRRWCRCNWSAWFLSSPSRTGSACGRSVVSRLLPVPPLQGSPPARLRLPAR